MPKKTAVSKAAAAARSAAAASALSKSNSPPTIPPSSAACKEPTLSEPAAGTSPSAPVKSSADTQSAAPLEAAPVSSAPAAAMPPVPTSKKKKGDALKRSELNSHSTKSVKAHESTGAASVPADSGDSNVNNSDQSDDETQVAPNNGESTPAAKCSVHSTQDVFSQSDRPAPPSPSLSAGPSDSSPPSISTTIITQSAPPSVHPHTTGSSEASDDLVRHHVVMRVLISTKEAGIVIGQSGATVAEIRQHTSARVTVSDMVSGAHERVLTVAGPLDSVAMAFSMVATRIAEKLKPHDGSTSRSSSRIKHDRLSGNDDEDDVDDDDDDGGGGGGKSLPDRRTLEPADDGLEGSPSTLTVPSDILNNNTTTSRSPTPVFSTALPKNELPVKSRPISIRFLIPHVRMGSVIGRHGIKIKEIQELSGSRITASEELLPNSTERVVTVTGVIDAIHIASYHLGLVLLDHPERTTGLLYYKPIPGFVHRPAVAASTINPVATVLSAAGPVPFRGTTETTGESPEVGPHSNAASMGESSSPSNGRRRGGNTQLGSSPSAGVQVPYGMYPIQVFHGVAPGAVTPTTYYAPIPAAYLGQAGYTVGAPVLVQHPIASIATPQVVVPHHGALPSHNLPYRSGQSPSPVNSFYSAYPQPPFAIVNANAALPSRSPSPHTSGRPQQQFGRHNGGGASRAGLYTQPQTPTQRHGSTYQGPARLTNAAQRRSFGGRGASRSSTPNPVVQDKTDSGIASSASSAISSDEAAGSNSLEYSANRGADELKGIVESACETGGSGGTNGIDARPPSALNGESYPKEPSSSSRPPSSAASSVHSSAAESTHTTTLPPSSASAGDASKPKHVFIPNALVGAVIGKGGSRISEIRQASGCYIKIGEYGSSASIQEVLAAGGIVGGSADSSMFSSDAQTDENGAGAAAAEEEDGAAASSGLGGKRKKKKKANGVKTSGGGRLLTITGSPEATKVALFMLQQRLEVEGKRHAPGSRRW